MKIELRLKLKQENKITRGKNGANVPHLEIAEVVLVHCNIVNKDYQQDSRVLYTFGPNKSFDSLLEISPTNSIFLKTFNSEFSHIEVWFTYQNSQTLQAEDRINLTLVIKWCSYYKNDQIYVKGYGFLSFTKNMSKKYIQKRLDTAKKSTTDAIKTASKRAIQKAAEATYDLIDNKIEDNITIVSKSSQII